MSGKQRNAMAALAEYVNPTQAADIIGCTEGRVYQLNREGRFKDRLPIGKNRFLLSRREVEKIAKSPAKTGRPRINLAS